MLARVETKSRKGFGRAMKGALIAGCALAATAVAAATFGAFGTPVSAEQGSHPELNTAANEGCPILSPNGKALFFASNRTGGLGGLDIWVARRRSVSEGWGEPVNLGEPVNSAADDFCPTPAPGRRLFFVSKRTEPNGDIYLTRQLGNGDFQQPTHLTQVNSLAQEWSPSYYQDREGREILYFSSTRSGGPGLQDIYFSVDYGPAQLAPGDLNTEFDDARPNLSRNGREIVFDSTRPGGLGGPDVYTSRRASANHPWPAATHLPQVSSPGSDTRASLSWDGSLLLVGSNGRGGEGFGDLYVASRPKTGSGSSAD